MCKDGNSIQFMDQVHGHCRGYLFTWDKTRSVISNIMKKSIIHRWNTALFI